MNKPSNTQSVRSRLYDPLLGKFLSADPFVANAGFTQDFNRSSYVLINPLRFRDPSGWQLAPINQYWNMGKERTNFTRFSGYEVIGNDQGWGGGPAFYSEELGPTLNQELNALDEGIYKYDTGLGRFVLTGNNQQFTWAIYGEKRYYNNYSKSSFVEIGNGKDYIRIYQNGAIKGDLANFFANPQGGGGRSNFFDLIDNTAFIGETATGGRLTVEMEYIRQARYNNRLAGTPGKGVPNSLRTISKTGKVLGAIGVGAVYGNATYEVIQGTHNTHTWVDVTISTGLFVAAIAGGPITVGVAAVLGLTYGASQLFVGDEMEGLIDNNFGYR